MSHTLKDVIALVKELPENCFDEAFEKLKEIKGNKDNDDCQSESKQTTCIHCGSTCVVRNGKRNGRQAYLCRDCKKTFVETVHSAIAHSHSSQSVWRAVVCDTVNGISLDKTAQSLDLDHATVFHMRHKILYCIEQALIEQPTEMIGVCEADETYILESVKGTKMPENYHRKPRKHGAVASKRGISEEYICVCASVTGIGENMSVAVNRATPSSQEILNVFGERVSADTIILCDGAKSYNALEEKCTVATTKRINKINGFHSFIQERIRAARGVASIYLNRYNALFAKVYAAPDSIVDDIMKLMTSRNNSFASIDTVKSSDLFII